MKKQTIFLWPLVCCLFLLASCAGKSTGKTVYNLADYGIRPDTKENISPLIAKAIQDIRQEVSEGQEITILLPAGRYDFYPDQATSRTYFVSNHDQPNPKAVGVALEDMEGITFDGQDAELVFHGRMLPVSLLRSKNCTLKNFSIDFEQPHITQASVVANDTKAGQITLELAPWVQYVIVGDTLYVKGEGWRHCPSSCIAFEPETRRLVYNSSDVRMVLSKVKDLGGRKVLAEGWKNPLLVPGTVLAMRTWQRPAPGVFLSHNTNTVLKNIQVHYAEGMGLLAQVCDNIRLDSFSVCLKGKEDPRYFTTQADATHFSNCKGLILSENGLYENMMDDAINVHGVYLKVQQRIDEKTLLASFEHAQSYGFDWGFAGDTVQFIRSKTMELLDGTYQIASIRPEDQDSVCGAKVFRIAFTQALPAEVTPEQSIGVENLTWTPEVVFAHNTIRHNRARGSLFSTPKKTVVENNLFDYTSGTAILLCGDCNGWYETGACRDIVIRHNTFINALTNMFQFTNAVISIYPEIPDLEHQEKYFHSGIVIEDNEFETFDAPILYAKSVDGLVFRHNTIHQNEAYPPFHWNKHRVLLERVTNATIEDNQFEGGFDPANDILQK